MPKGRKVVNCTFADCKAMNTVGASVKRAVCDNCHRAFEVPKKGA